MKHIIKLPVTGRSRVFYHCESFHAWPRLRDTKRLCVSTLALDTGAKNVKSATFDENSVKTLSNVVVLCRGATSLRLDITFNNPAFLLRRGQRTALPFFKLCGASHIATPSFMIPIKFRDYELFLNKNMDFDTGYLEPQTRIGWSRDIQLRYRKRFLLAGFWNSFCTLTLSELDFRIMGRRVHPFRVICCERSCWGLCPSACHSAGVSVNG